MHRKISEKLGLKAQLKSIFVNADASALEAIDYPLLDLKTKLTGDFDYIHFFVKKAEDFHKKFPKLVQHLKSSGMIWVSWPKSGQLGTDLNIKSVIKIGYDYGLVESKSISINESWSALKFTHPKPGKVYNNSYGKLSPTDL